MKMKMKMKIILAVLCLFCVKVVSAQQITPKAYICDNKTYQLGGYQGGQLKVNGYLDYKEEDGSLDDGYRLVIYGAWDPSKSVNGPFFYALTSCISPNKHGVETDKNTGNPIPGSSEYSCTEKINPTTNDQFNLAVIYAYQKLLDMGYRDSVDVQLIGYVTHRWLAYHYNRADTTGDSEITNTAGYTINELWENPNHSFWDKNGPYYQEALNLYNETVSVVSKYKTYDAMLADDVIWNPKWSYEILNRSVGSVQIKVNLNTNVDRVYWDEFEVSCTNSYTCKVASVTDKTNNSAVVTISISGENSVTSFYDLKLKVHTSWYDRRSGVANSFIISSKEDLAKYPGARVQEYGWQRYLVTIIDDYDERGRDSTEITIGGGYCLKNGDDPNNWVCADLDPVDGQGEKCTVRNPSNPEAQWNQECWALSVQKCSCDESTGRYTFTYAVNGVVDPSRTRTWKYGETPPTDVDTSVCPGTCGKVVCDKTPANKNDWVCADLEPDGNLDGQGEKCASRTEVQDGTHTVEEQWNQECWAQTIPKCTCNESTGVYTYTFYNNGVLDPSRTRTWKYGETPPTDVDTSGCPNKCGETPPPPGDDEKNICKDPSESTDGEYHCKDGKKCRDEEQYYEECACGKLEDKCKEHPEDPDCDKYYKYCINCNPTVTIPSDCADLQEYGKNIYAGNYTGGISDIPKKDTECNSNQSNMIKSCVIGKKDATGVNSFEDTTVSTKDNPYCSIWCEESYDFGLPVAKYTQSGRYFTLSTSVKGTRTCYTSARDDSTKPIDEDKFNTDLEAARKAIIDAYNNYAYWSARASAEYNSVTLDEKPCYKKDENGKETTELMCTAQSGTEYNKKLKYTVYTYDGNDVEIDGTSTGSCTSSQKVNDQDYVCVVSFSGTAASCGTNTCNDAVSGSKSDDKTNADGVTYVNEQKASALKTLNDKITAFNNIIAQYNSCSGNMTGTTNGWTNDIQFDPEITFSYNENYLNNSSDGKFEQTSVSTDTTKSTYCTTDTNRKYECLNDTEKNNPVINSNNVPASAQATVKYFGCDSSGCSGEKTYTVSTAKWVKKERTVEADYKPRTNFSTYTQYGTIQKDVTTGKYTLYTPLPDNVFPVSLMTETGVFPFTIKFNNIGRSNSDKDKLGRLIGENYGGDILTAYNKLSSGDKCDINGKKDNSFQSATTQSGYVCHYINNCDECRIECEDGDCSFDDNCDGECTYTCENCLFDGNSATYTFRTVSLNNLFPNDRTKGQGTNWNSSLKGSVSKAAIEDAGESIYQKAQYSYTLTPTSIAKIREYNDKAGSYTNTYVPSGYDTISVASNSSNEAVYCEQYQGTGANGESYNVKCRSKFLDILDALEGSGPGRAMASNITRVTRDSNAWELFDEYCPVYGTGECRNIGPSWRLRSVD